MSYPRKHRGRRAITVDGRQYRWKLWPSSPNSRLVVTGTKNGGQRLEVTLRDWQDPWQAISGVTVEEGSLTLLTDAVNSPTVIASGVVREMIEFAVGRGWNSDVPAPPLYVDYTGGRPALSAAPSRSPKKPIGFGHVEDISPPAGHQAEKSLIDSALKGPAGKCSFTALNRLFKLQIFNFTAVTN